MRYFKAIAVDYKPFINWLLVASSLSELENLGLDNDPLVLQETDVPDFIYGVCPLKIVGGELIDRTVPEMEVFQEEFEVKTLIAESQYKVTDLKTSTFTYDSNDFFMDETARLFYLSIEKLRGNQKILTTAGATYTLLDTATNIDDFLEAYFEKLMLVTKPNI